MKGSGIGDVAMKTVVVEGSVDKSSVWRCKKGEASGGGGGDTVRMQGVSEDCEAT